MRPRPLAALLALALTAALTTLLGTAARADSAADRKRQLDRSARSSQGQIDDISRELAGALARLRSAQGELSSAEAGVRRASAQLSAAQAEDARIGAQLDLARRQEHKAQVQLDAVVASMADDRDAVGRIARTAYMSGNLGQLGVALSAESPDDFASRVVLTQAAARSQNAAIARLAQRRAVQAERTAQLAAQRARVDALKARSAAAVERTAALRQQAEQARARVASVVAAARSATARLQAEKAAEQRRLAAMQAESSRLADQLRAAAGRASRGGGARYVSGNGTLGRPVNAPVTSSYGMRVHPVTGIYKLHDGTDFGVGCGTPIHAAQDGVVVRASYAAGYGNWTIIDHGTIRGQSVATAYAHQSSFAVRTGQRVSKGQVIGYVGSTGYSTGCHMHFMVYVNGGTVNPMGWL